MSIPISARFLNLHPDHLKVIGTDQLGVTVDPAGAIQVDAGAGLDLKSTIPGLHTFTQIPSCSVAPTGGNHLVNKTYVDACVNGLAWKDAVRAHASANITLSGEQTIDGVAVVAGDRVLVSGQSTAAQDGIYVAAAGAWSRSADCAIGETIGGVTVHVREGVNHGNKTYAATNEGLVNTDGWSVALIAGGAIPTPGNGIESSMNTWAVLASDNSIEVSGTGVSVKLNPTNSGLEKSSGMRVNISGLTESGAADDGDYLMIHDTSAGALRKQLRSIFLTGVGGGPGGGGSTKFAEYVITGANITAKNATIPGVAGAVSVNNLVFLNGVQLNASDATLNTTTGLLEWTGLSLDGRIAAGDKIQVWGRL